MINHPSSRPVPKRIDVLNALRDNVRKELVDASILPSDPLPTMGEKINVSGTLFIGSNSIALKIAAPTGNLTTQETAWLEAFVAKLEAGKRGSTSIKSDFQLIGCQGLSLVNIEVGAYSLSDLINTLNAALSEPNRFNPDVFLGKARNACE